MQIVRDTADCPASAKGASLAIGNFDGVHRGHQAVIRAAIEAAVDNGAPSGAMTFEPHPRQYFQPGKAVFRLTPEPLKLKLFDALGLDVAAVLEFGERLASLPARDFVSRILVDGLDVSHVVTGSNFQFGKGRDGNPQVLRALGQELGFGVTIVEPQGADGATYSSTRVRECLANGDPQGAAEILGYRWRVMGEVVGGDKRGHGLGFPTANIAVTDGFALKHGIYAVRVEAAGKRFGGAAYLGTRPSFDDGAPVIETFLFDFAGDLYGQEITLEFIAWLRGDEKFESSEALAAQMGKDCEAAKAVLAGLEKNDPLAIGRLGAV